MTRRTTYWISGALAALLALSSPSLADDRLTILVPFPAGSTTDIQLRQIADKLDDTLGESVTVENQPGGNSQIAINNLKTTPGDPRKAMMISSSLVVSGSLPNAKFDIKNDFSPLFVWGRSSYLLVVRNDSPIQNMADVVRLSKDKPLTIAINGFGTATHVTTVLIGKKSGANLRPIPFKAGTETGPALIRGDVDISFESYSVARAFIEAGQTRAIAVTSVDRLPQLPDVPGMQESGVEGVDVSFWLGLVMGAGTDQARVEKVNKALEDVFADTAFRDEFEKRNNMVYMGGSTEFLRDLIVREEQQWSELIAAEGISVE